MSSRVVVFTDGASVKNPGPGGWGAVLAMDDTVVELGGAEELTTNNRMEMRGALEALRFLAGRAPRATTIYTDSSYLVQGITKWIHGWKRRGWRTKLDEPVLNQDLWVELEELARGRSLRWQHLRGHAGIPGNERADTIASAFARAKAIDLYVGPAADYPIDLEAVETPVAAPPRRSRSGKPLAYLSLVEGVLERHATWAECERRVKGVPAARFKKVMSEAEIATVLTAWGVAQGSD